VGEFDQSTLAELIEALPDDLRLRALTHRSWAEKEGESYERLAYLGDSVLALAVASASFARFPELSAGELTKIHNQAVSGLSCTAVGRELGIPTMLQDSEPKDLQSAIPTEVLLGGGRPLAEATEALIGACFVAFGFERTAAAVVDAFDEKIEDAVDAETDAKSALQEMLARRKTYVSYEVIEESGPPHQRTFEVVAIVDSEQVGVGSGRSKKAAEQAAAEQALRRLGG
jgi:ribonuclease-3